MPFGVVCQASTIVGDKRRVSLTTADGTRHTGTIVDEHEGCLFIDLDSQWGSVAVQFYPNKPGSPAYYRPEDFTVYADSETVYVVRGEGEGSRWERQSRTPVDASRPTLPDAPEGNAYLSRLRLMAAFFAWSSDPVSKDIGKTIEARYRDALSVDASTPQEAEDRLQAVQMERVAGSSEGRPDPSLGMPDHW